MVAFTLGNLIEPILSINQFDEGKKAPLLHNDPYSTGGAVSHLPTLFLCQSFREKRHCFRVAGDTLDRRSGAGSISPNATSVFHEGIMIPRESDRAKMLKVRILMRNTRFLNMLQDQTA